jgi:hypothetical protein
VLSDTPQALEPGTSKTGRWLQERRIRIAVWIAALEGLIVLFSHGITRWTVVVLAIVGMVAWFAGRDSSSHTLRQVLWIFAASQLLAVLVTILSWIVKWAVITGVIVLAVVGVAYLILDRR